MRIQECEEELLKDQILLRSFVTLSEDTTMTTTINWKEHSFVVKYAKKVSVAWEMPMLVQHHLTDNTCYEDICFCAIIRYCVSWIDI